MRSDRELWQHEAPASTSLGATVLHGIAGARGRARATGSGCSLSHCRRQRATQARQDVFGGCGGATVPRLSRTATVPQLQAIHGPPPTRLRRTSSVDTVG